jgi:hypothetical protein
MALAAFPAASTVSSASTDMASASRSAGGSAGAAAAAGVTGLLALPAGAGAGGAGDADGAWSLGFDGAAAVPLLPPGTMTGLLHLLHFPCLPARESGTLILHWHFGQVMMIAMVRGIRFWASGHSSMDAGGGATVKPFDIRWEVT